MTTDTAPTPETDAAFPSLNLSYRDLSNTAWLLRDFARNLERQLAAKSAKCDRMREDAERYRWLRENLMPLSEGNGWSLSKPQAGWPHNEEVEPDDLDDTIDAARGAKK